MKKFLSVLFALTLLFVAGCGNSASDKKEITLLQNKPEVDEQLKALAKSFEEEKGIKVNVKSCGGECEMAKQLQADIAAGETPDLFVIDGMDAYNTFKDQIIPLSDEKWVDKTEYEFMADNEVYGFPVGIEGWGLAYNKDILDKAGIDPMTLTSYDAYVAAFAKLDSMKAELGIESVVSMAAGPGMYWVTGDHNFNAYLANGLEYDDMTYVDQTLDGKLDANRFAEYTNWVDLLFKYSDKTVLTTGDYDAQVGAFVEQKSAFVHQGSWIEPNLKDAGAEFDRGFAPYGSTVEATDGIFVSAPSWYVVSKDSKMQEEAKMFLDYITTSDAGQKYYEDIGAIPAFTTIESKVTAPLAMSIAEWSDAGKTYAWNQYYIPKETRDALGGIYDQLAQGKITKEEFIQLFTTEIEKLGK